MGAHPGPFVWLRGSATVRVMEPRVKVRVRVRVRARVRVRVRVRSEVRVRVRADGGPRACVVLAAEAREPVGPAAHDRGGDGDRLHVGDGGGAAVEPGVGGEGRLEPRLAWLALEALDEARLLAANVRAAAAVQVHVKVDAGAARVLADHARVVGLLDGVLEHHRLVHELAWLGVRVRD